MANRVSVNVVGLPQAVQDDIQEFYGITTANQLAAYLRDTFVADLKARRVYRAKQVEATANEDFSLDT